MPSCDQVRHCTMWLHLHTSGGDSHTHEVKVKIKYISNYFCILRLCLAMQHWKVWNVLSRPEQPPPQRDPTVSASQLLGLNVCVTMARARNFLRFGCCCFFMDCLFDSLFLRKSSVSRVGLELSLKPRVTWCFPCCPSLPGAGIPGQSHQAPAIAGEIPVETRLDLNSQRCACLCLLSTGVKGRRLDSWQS